MYEKEITQLIEKINSLEKLYEQTTQQLSDSQDLFWTIILGVFAVIGIALYFIARSLVKEGIEKGIREKFIEDPEFTGKMTLKSRHTNQDKMSLVMLQDGNTINIETSENNARLTINHNEVFCKKIIKHNSPMWHGYSGSIRAYSNGNGLVCITINQLEGGIIYHGNWTICGEIPKELIPTQEIIYNQIIREDYIVQIKIGNGKELNRHPDQDKIFIRILSDKIDIENMKILRVPVSTTIVYLIEE